MCTMVRSNGLDSRGMSRLPLLRVSSSPTLKKCTPLYHARNANPLAPRTHALMRHNLLLSFPKTKTKTKPSVDVCLAVLGRVWCGDPGAWRLLRRASVRDRSCSGDLRVGHVIAERETFRTGQRRVKVLPTSIYHKAVRGKKPRGDPPPARSAREDQESEESAFAENCLGSASGGGKGGCGYCCCCS